MTEQIGPQLDVGNRFGRHALLDAEAALPRHGLEFARRLKVLVAWADLRKPAKEELKPTIVDYIGYDVQVDCE